MCKRIEPDKAVYNINKGWADLQYISLTIEKISTKEYLYEIKGEGYGNTATLTDRQMNKLIDIYNTHKKENVNG